MPTDCLMLRPLRVEDESSFRRAVEAFGGEQPPWPFAFDYDPAGDFAAYVAKLENWSRGLELQDGFVPNSYLAGVVDGEIVGRLSLRHRLNDFLATVGGHIGYGVVPAHRGRGHATTMLRLALPLCAALGIERALLTCDVDNAASRRVIEKCGGVLEGITHDPSLDVQKRRYWIATR